MTARTIAIGDIHGCAEALRTIVGAIAPQSNDTIVVLGDCVDRGPQSADAINQLLALCERCRLVPLLGNHEEMMLAARESDAASWAACAMRKGMPPAPTW